MTITILHDDGQTRITAVYQGGKLQYTRTYITDPDGFLEKTVTVFSDGTYEIKKEEE
jgi:hypothetical protein